MPSYSTPGVYVEEIPVFPPSVAPVATAIPAFIGYTQTAIDGRGEDQTKKAVRITSLLEYEAYFGKSPVQAMRVKVTKHLGTGNKLLRVDVGWDGIKPTVPTYLLHYAMQMYFANGGGPCYVYSVGPYSTQKDTQKADFTDAITALEKEDEPTLLVFPDAVNLVPNKDSEYSDYGSVVDAALKSCNKTQDRFTIADVPNAVVGGTDNNSNVNKNFRNTVDKNTVEFLKYGAAYFPYVKTNIPFATADKDVTVTLEEGTSLGAKPEAKSEGGAGQESQPAAQSEGSTGQGTQPPESGVRDAGEDAKPMGNESPPAKTPESKTLADLKESDTAVYAAIQAFIRETCVTLPPSAAIAGVYAQVDRTRGVWKSPANVALSRVIGPAVNATNDLQDGLNIDAASGKSVNVIRAFFGRGTLVWGGRTLAGNDNEWRYINVRRFANFVEESVRKALATFVFEPNDANTWVRARTMTENFLINQWRDGALMGAKPERAFRVYVGLGQTMSAQDVVDGKMIVEVHLAIVRPAEFIVLRFMQKMPEA